MHFTRMGGYGEAGRADHRRAATGATSRTRTGKRYLDALAGPVLRQHRLRLRRGDRPGRARADARAALLHELDVRAPAGDRARGRGRVARARRPQPRLLRLGRLGGGRVGLEARAPVLPRARREAAARARSARARARPRRDRRRTSARRAAPLQGDHAPHRLPRHDASARSRSTGSRRSGCRSSRSCPRCGTCATRTATAGPPARPRRSSPQFLLDELEQTIVAMGPETVCLVHMEPVQNAAALHAAGRLLARRARDLRPRTTSCSPPTR